MARAEEHHTSGFSWVSWLFLLLMVDTRVLMMMNAMVLMMLNAMVLMMKLSAMI